MRASNAYYRKHKTMRGYGNLTDEEADQNDKTIKAGYSWEQQPYPAYLLSNNNANIKRVRDRVEALESAKENPLSGWSFPGGSVVANTEENRLQIFFDEKPDEEMRQALKGRGFRWAPSQGAWQRQLTKNAIYDAKRVLPAAEVEDETQEKA